MRKYTVFLVDDHKILRESLIYLLKQEPELEVVGEAADGHDAYRDIMRIQPDIAVLDISIPRLNGLDLAAKLKQDLPQLKIVMLTMHKSEEFIARAYSAGVSGYLLKENALEELLKCIRQVIAGKTYISEDMVDTVIHGFVKSHQTDSGGKAPEMISSREREIVQLLAEGRSNRDIAELLNLSVKTVETHRANIMKKLNFKSITDLVLYAVRNHLIEP